MDRRSFLKAALALPLLPGSAGAQAAPGLSRVRPGQPGWPSAASWDGLDRDVGGRLIRLQSPLGVCQDQPSGAACREIFKELKNPYFIGDDPCLTQTTGWVDAWTSQPSVYAVAARRTEDVVAAVNFARENNLRLVVKGGGHSYLGTSNAPDSLLIWTRAMNDIVLHDAFVAQGCDRAAVAAARRLGRRRRDLDAYLQRSDDQGRPLRPGRRLRHGRRGGPGPGRRVRQLFEDLRHRRGEPAGGGNRHGRRRRAHRQRLHEPRSVLGAERRRRRHLRGASPA